MGDSLITIVAVFVAAVLMFVFPLMAMSERSDDVSQLSVQQDVTDFVDGVRNTGQLTLDAYDRFMQKIASTGNSFEVDIELQILDENPGVKTTQAEMTKIGENFYYNKYTTQVEEELQSNGRIRLKEGDRISVSVKNTNKTISQSLKNFFYGLAGNDTYQIYAQNSGVVSVNGTR